MEEEIVMHVSDWRKDLIERLIKVEAMNLAILNHLASLESLISKEPYDDISKKIDDEIYSNSLELLKSDPDQ